jgi:hypothetical protein
MPTEPRWDLVYKWADPETRSIVDAVSSALENCDKKLTRAEARQGTLDAAWERAEKALPEGWLFHGVSLVDHSMDDGGGGWGPDWEAATSWPDHCEYDDCDHDEAFRVGTGSSPIEALLALSTALEAMKPEHVKQSVNGCVTCSRKWSDHTDAERG